MKIQVRKPEEAPVPTSRGGRGNPTYPWSEIPVGGSIKIEVNPGEDVAKRAASVQSSGYNWCRRNAEHLRVRVTKDVEAGVVEAWLIERPEGTNGNTADEPEEAVSEEASEETVMEGSDDPLPPTFPGRRELVKAGIDSLAKLQRAVASGEISKVKGIGKSTAEKIQSALPELD